MIINPLRTARWVPLCTLAGAGLLLAGCVTPATSGDPLVDQGRVDGCHTGREEGFREVHGGVPQTPQVALEQYRDQPAYRDAWDEAFWRCYRRVPGMTLTGVADGPGGAITRDWARGWVDDYLRSAGALDDGGT